MESANNEDPLHLMPKLTDEDKNIRVPIGRMGS